MSGNIFILPDFAALKKLAVALWQQDNSYFGAAVMVGAGFSRVAATSGDSKKKLPLWGELSNLLAVEIGSGSQTDPLRQAEEYRAYFGQQAMLDLLKKAIHDEAWTPGKLHKDLLELPWSEVLTTNWDTLLERVAVEIHQPVYSVVHRQEDLASARAPRIVKLHGTIGVNDELVFTQEDFRKYPQRHAAFVNLARQVFIENELCLLGFSGDDPNFLQWAGWVRDHLATHARRIYLVGALSLTAAKRKYLESINVAPIDLTPLVADYDDHDAKHAAATRIFIEALRSLKPKPNWEWTPTLLHRTTLTSEEMSKTDRDAAYAAKLLEEQIPVLERDRLAYPGWLACPSSLIFRLQSQVNDPYPTAKRLAAMTPDSRARLLYEIAWRHEVTYETTPPWLARELLTICDTAKPCVLPKKQQMEVAMLLLKSSRWLDESDAEPIVRATNTILESGTKHWPESANELVYHRGIIARDRFDYPAIKSAAENLDTSDAVWKLRKASLLGELGQFEEGKSLIAEAYRELLGQHRNDKNSIHVLSRLAWAHWMLRGVDMWTPGREFKAFPSFYQDPKCSPLDVIEHVQDRISKTLERQSRQRGVEPSFKPGTYRDNSRTVTFSNEVHPLLLLDGMSRAVGMPLRWERVSFLVESAAKIAELEDLDDVHRFAVAIRSASSETSGVLKGVFSRIRVARISNESATWLLNRGTEAIEYWSDRLVDGSEGERGFAIDRLCVFLEVLGRISVRATPEQAKAILKKGLALGQTSAFQRHRLVDALSSLIENALKSIPNMHQHEVLWEALSFPLQSEISVKNGLDRWPNPIIRCPGSRSSNPALGRRIDEIIDFMVPPQSAPALLRLFPLLDAGFLTEAESEKIGDKLWGREPDYRTVPETGVLPHSLLELPAPDGIAARNAVKRHLFEAREDHLFNRVLLLGVANAPKVKEYGAFPSAEQAAIYFERLTSWRAKEESGDPFGIADDREKEMGNSIAKALAYAVVPALPVEELDQEKFDKLYAFHEEVGAWESIVALSPFAASNDRFAVKMEKLIRQGLQSQEASEVASSALALLKWREICSSPVTAKLISRMVYLLGVNLDGGLPTLLQVARQMYSKGYVPEEDAASLEEIVPVVFDGANYKNVDPFSRQAISISLVRVECVKLARTILNVGQSNNGELLRVLSEARQDSLPEVRFADTSDD